MDHSQHSMDATSHAGHLMAGMNHGAPGMASGAHDKHAGHSVAMFRDKFWLSLGTVLSARRAAKRRLEDPSQPGSPDRVAAESETEHFRAEYRRLARESARRNPASAS
jgi:hypothetical protein